MLCKMLWTKQQKVKKFFHLKLYLNYYQLLTLTLNELTKGSRDGVVVIAPMSATNVARVRFWTRGHMWVKFVVGSLLCSERLFSGFSGFCLSPNINICIFPFNQMQYLPENHFHMTGASWVNIINHQMQ